MPTIPREPGLDSTRELFADPYRYIGKRCRAHGAPLFRTRLLLRATICMSGPQAAQLFYDPKRFVRRGAAPEPLRATLFGKGGVQSLDGDAHRLRKQLFLGLTSQARTHDLVRLVSAQWEAQALRWTRTPCIALYEEVQQLLARAVCAWAGVPLIEAEVGARTRELAALFDRAGAIGAGHFESRLARLRAERWIGQLIVDIRAGRHDTGFDSPAHAIAWHREADGALLAPRIAAVEVLNLLRPTVAVAVFVVFAAHALALHPQSRQRIATGDDAYLGRFVQEVRRFYPFFPAVLARVRDEFRWQGYRFPSRARVLLDLYGTNHDPDAWDEPDLFEPERFASGTPSAFEMIPQGGGEPARTHRCPGEGITIALMHDAVAFLCHRIRYSVPAQDLSIDFERLPALPRGGFALSDVRFAARASVA